MLKKLKLAVLSLSSLLILSLPVALSGFIMTGTANAASTACGSSANNTAVCNCLNQGSNLDFGTTSTCSGTNADTGSSLTDFVSRVLNILSIVVAVAAVVMIIVAGFTYVTSGGKDESVKNAKNMILYAIIGLIVVALAQVIVRFVLNRTTT